MYFSICQKKIIYKEISRSRMTNIQAIRGNKWNKRNSKLSGTESDITKYLHAWNKKKNFKNSNAFYIPFAEITYSSAELHLKWKSCFDNCFCYNIYVIIMSIQAKIYTFRCLFCSKPKLYREVNIRKKR